MSRYLIAGVILAIGLLSWWGVESAAQFGEEDFTESGDDQALTPLQQAGQLVERQNPEARPGLAEDTTLTPAESAEETQAQPADTTTPTDDPTDEATPTPTTAPREPDDSIPALW